MSNILKSLIINKWEVIDIILIGNLCLQWKQISKEGNKKIKILHCDAYQSFHLKYGSFRPGHFFGKLFLFFSTYKFCASCYLYNNAYDTELFLFYFKKNNIRSFRLPYLYMRIIYPSHFISNMNLFDISDAADDWKLTASRILLAVPKRIRRLEFPSIIWSRHTW